MLNCLPKLIIHQQGYKIGEEASHQFSESSKAGFQAHLSANKI